MDGTLAVQKFLANKEWWIKEETEAFFLHVIHQEKEYVSRPMPKLHALLFKNNTDIQMTIVKTVISSIETQIMRDDNEKKMKIIKDLKEGRRKSFVPPFWKRNKK